MPLHFTWAKKEFLKPDCNIAQLKEIGDIFSCKALALCMTEPQDYQPKFTLLANGRTRT